MVRVYSWFDKLTTNGEWLTTNGGWLTTNGEWLTTNGGFATVVHPPRVAGCCDEAA